VRTEQTATHEERRDERGSCGWTEGQRLPPEQSEIAEIAGDLSRVCGGADLRWAEATWQLLRGSVSTAMSSGRNGPICTIRLVALNAFNREFCVRAFEEGSTALRRH
jgi:hypothetical protein